MNELLDKLTSYNIFNYLFPGTIFVIIAKAITNYDFIQENNLLGGFLYYFIGMIISRFGSVIIEPILKKTNFLKFQEYSEYIYASKNDAKIELLSEVNNTYRTLSSMILLLLILKLYNYFSIKFNFSTTLTLIVLTMLILVLFLFSYRKQANYITKRIDTGKQNKT
ncbi:hypothetical protein JYU05_02285 [bacterium AH-315-P13]|nr:hypothetical protein [bacterium AH-315-P13]